MNEIGGTGDSNHNFKEHSMTFAALTKQVQGATACKLKKKQGEREQLV